MNAVPASVRQSLSSLIRRLNAAPSFKLLLHHSGRSATVSLAYAWWLSACGGSDERRVTRRGWGDGGVLSSLLRDKSPILPHLLLWRDSSLLWRYWFMRSLRW